MTWTKLHHLCGAQTNPSNTAAILLHSLRHPDDIYEVEDHGYTPLHIEAVRGDHPREEVVKALLQANPNVVLKKDLHGSTPLHLTLIRDVSPKIVQLMLDANHTVAFEKDKEGLMPLHVACRYCPGNEEVIRILIEVNPNALRSRTRMGYIVQKKNGGSPIEIVRHDQHIVLDGRTSSEWRESQIKSVAEGRLEEERQQLREGSYPLHMAIANGSAPQKVLVMLMKESPEVTSKTDKFGRTCLHLALKNGGSAGENNENVTANSQQEKHTNTTVMDVVKLIHSLDASQVKARDESYHLPLHMACKAGCSIDVVKFLVTAYPESIHVKNKDENRPLDVAVTYGRCSKELINFLSEITKEVNIEVAQ